MEETGWGMTYLEGNVLPMDRVNGLDDGHGRLEIAATAVKLAVKSDVLQ